LNLNTAGNSLVFTVGTTTSTQVWTASVFTSGQSPAWLTVYPLSGAGSASVIVAPVSGLSSGTYSANVVFQSADAQPQLMIFPVNFTVQ
jgi:hypothetical protein